MEQAASVELGQLRVNLVERLPLTAGGGVPLFEFERNIGALGQGLDGSQEIHAFVELEEFEDVAARAATEALEYLALRIDVERGRLLLVKRAAGFEAVGAGAFQGDVGADHIHNVIAEADFIDDSFWDACHCPRFRRYGRLNSLP